MADALPFGPDIAGPDALGDEVGCPHCGALQRLPRPRRASTVACGVCRSELERTTGRGLDAALAFAASTLLLLAPANLMPFLATGVLGVERNSRLASGAVAMWTDGWPLLGLAVGLFTVVFPIVRFGLLTAVLGALRLGARPRWLGRAFRVANELQTWAMLEVFLLGLWVAYERLRATVDVKVGAGGVCFIAAAILSLAVRAALDKRAVWRLIGPERPAPAGEAASACLSCELLLPASAEGRPCPRCGDPLSSREPQGVGRAAALTLAGLLLYIPANLLPIATLPIGLTPTKYTVLEGVIDLVKAGLAGLALLVFTASFAIPFLKLAGLGYCVASVMRRSGRRLVFKTRVYRVVEEIGRWSMVDPFVIACFVPVMRYNTFIYGRAEPAAPAFAGVVVLTMLAARLFDPRAMWDAAARGRPAGARAAA